MNIPIILVKRALKFIFSKCVPKCALDKPQTKKKEGRNKREGPKRKERGLRHSQAAVPFLFLGGGFTSGNAGVHESHERQSLISIKAGFTG
jgi:hypothetical protein